MDQQRTSKKARREGDDDLKRHLRQQALQLIKNGSVDFERLPDELRDDAEIALAWITWIQRYYCHLDMDWEAISDRLRSNKEFVLEAVKTGGWFLEFASEELRADREVVSEAVYRHGYSLKFASEELRGDRQLVLIAVGENGLALEFASEELRGDRDVVFKAMADETVVWQFASQELRANREVVLEVVRQYGCWETLALKHASEELRADRELVREAVRLNGQALEFASEELRADREIVLEAVRQNGRALEYASEELRTDREIVLAAVRQWGFALKYASEELQADREIVLVAVQQCGSALQFASDELRADREIVLEAVSQKGCALRYASEEFRADQEIVLAGLRNAAWDRSLCDELLSHVPDNLLNDPLVAGTIIRARGSLRQRSEIMERLENVLLAVRALPEDFVGIIVDEESVVELCRRWEHCIWHKIWIALRLEPPGMQGTGRMFVELSGLPLELWQAKELRHCAPVIGAVLSSFPNCDWREVDSYPAHDYMSESDDNESSDSEDDGN